MTNLIENPFLLRCFELAKLGGSAVFPNPRVGCVIVHENSVIGEGFHPFFGGPHAEVVAVSKVTSPEILSKATLYVSLEPCNHFGKTPPCVDLILKHRIPKVVVGMTDPNPLVAGKGIERLRANGVEVELYAHPAHFEALNPAFLTNQRMQRTHVVLKWAQGANGTMGDRNRRLLISGMEANRWTHALRANMQAILVGAGTCKVDDPRLNVRNAPGNSPLRIILDANLSVPKSQKLFTDGLPTWIVNHSSNAKGGNVRWVEWKDDGNWQTFFEMLFQKEKISNVLVEGGAEVLTSLLTYGVWDEAYVIQSPQKVEGDVDAPEIFNDFLETKFLLGKDEVRFYKK